MRCACAPPCKRLCRFTPGVLAPVRVIVSRSLYTYSTPCAPLVGTARLRRTAVYTCCPRCVHKGPRRPASGSELSLSFFIDMSPSETPGSSSAAYTQFLHRRRWPSTIYEGLGTSETPHPPIPVGERISRLHYGWLSLTTCRFVCPPVGADSAYALPTRTFTPGLPADWSPAPPPGIATGTTG